MRSEKIKAGRLFMAGEGLGFKSRLIGQMAVSVDRK